MLVTGSVYVRHRRSCSMFLAPTARPSVTERLTSLQLECGTLWQLQYSPQSHLVLFVAVWKLNCSRILTADTVCLTTELLRDSFSLSQQLLLLLQPWSWSINYNVAMTFINNNDNNNNNNNNNRQFQPICFSLLFLTLGIFTTEGIKKKKIIIIHYCRYLPFALGLLIVLCSGANHTWVSEHRSSMLILIHLVRTF